MPHVPQWAGSVLRLKHVVPHMVSPAGQPGVPVLVLVQCPETQVSPEGQA